jgi:hypothetical protein
VGPESHFDRCIAYLADTKSKHSLILGALRSNISSSQPVLVKNVTVHGMSLLGAGNHEIGARVEILLRNVGWTSAYVCLCDDMGCEVIFEHYVSPTIPLAA